MHSRQTLRPPRVAQPVPTEQRMKRTLFSALILTVLAMVLPAGKVMAETLVFPGKAYCALKDDLRWPFKTGAVTTGQDKGFAMAVSLQPPKPDAEKTAAELGSDMTSLRVLAVNLHVGQHVTENEPLITYALPLDRVIKEKETLSRAKITSIESALALADYKLAVLTLMQTEMEKGVSLETAATGNVREASRNIESLSKQRASLTAARELAQARYDSDVEIARVRYGDILDPRQLPRRDAIRAPFDGHVLWVNPALVAGMSFTKQATLFSIGSLDPILVRAAVHEIALPRLKVGDPATVTFSSLPGQTFQTTIATINYVAQPATLQQPSFYTVELSLANPDLRIKEGMRCEVAVNVP
jgi:multidrug efflux pump subunit AcrA (membrane-fusion protein)